MSEVRIHKNCGGSVYTRYRREQLTITDGCSRCGMLQRRFPPMSEFEFVFESEKAGMRESSEEYKRGYRKALDDAAEMRDAPIQP